MSALPIERFEARPMTEEVVEAVYAVEREIYPFPWTAGNFRDSVRAGYSCWTYVDADRFVGYAVLMLAVDDAHLLNLSIVPERQGMGYGSRALSHLIDLARAHRARQMILEVRPSNAAGRALYRSFGFAQIGLRKGYYPAAVGREDAIVLSLPL